MPFVMVGFMAHACLHGDLGRDPSVYCLTCSKCIIHLCSLQEMLDLALAYNKVRDLTALEATK